MLHVFNIIIDISLMIALQMFQQVCYCLERSFNFSSIITCDGIGQHMFQLMLDSRALSPNHTCKSYWCSAIRNSFWYDHQRWSLNKKNMGGHHKVYYYSIINLHIFKMAVSNFCLFFIWFVTTWHLFLRTSKIKITKFLTHLYTNKTNKLGSTH